jgi:hypothetical protein
MMKIIKNIPVFFLWLAGLAVNAHMIIPHDHHLVWSGTSQEDSCPVSNSKSTHHSGFPIHCHAFNDLASEKATSYLVTRIAQHNDFIKSSLSDLIADKFQFSGIRIIDIREPFPDSHLLEFSSLRAPPSLN